jgi:hypothetical protein
MHSACSAISQHAVLGFGCASTAACVFVWTTTLPRATWSVDLLLLVGLTPQFQGLSMLSNVDSGVEYGILIPSLSEAMRDRKKEAISMGPAATQSMLLVMTNNILGAQGWPWSLLGVLIHARQPPSGPLGRRRTRLSAQPGACSRRMKPSVTLGL